MSFAELKAKSFEEKDVENFASLVNLMHTRIAGLSGKEAFEYFKLMQWAQHHMLPKIKQNVMGDPKIVTPEKDNKENKKKSSKKDKK